MTFIVNFPTQLKLLHLRSLSNPLAQFITILLSAPNLFQKM